MGRLSCHAEGYQYQLCKNADELDLEQSQRRSLLEGLWLNRLGSEAEERFREQIRNWREIARDFLV